MFYYVFFFFYNPLGQTKWETLDITPIKNMAYLTTLATLYYAFN